MFETDREVLRWYESQPRALSADFVAGLDWREVRDYPLSPAFVPVLLYMRDVEYFTDMYYRELLRTPTGRDPVIRKFMDRWSIEELYHANLINRFLGEAGIATDANWQNEASRKISWRYRLGSFIVDHATLPFGKYFHAAHMVWGAINEITTLQGYLRLAQLAEHPVLNKLLTGIMQEESVHASFYWHVARVKLAEEKFSRDLARFVIKWFWTPVGQGAKREGETNYVIATLFQGPKGLELFNRRVAGRIERLPGFAGFKGLTERVAPILQAAN